MHPQILITYSHDVNTAMRRGKITSDKQVKTVPYQKADLPFFIHNFLSVCTHFLTLVLMGCACYFLVVGLQNIWPATELLQQIVSHSCSGGRGRPLWLWLKGGANRLGGGAGLSSLPDE